MGRRILHYAAIAACLAVLAGAGYAVWWFVLRPEPIAPAARMLGPGASTQPIEVRAVEAARHLMTQSRRADVMLTFPRPATDDAVRRIPARPGEGERFEVRGSFERFDVAGQGWGTYVTQVRRDNLGDWLIDRVEMDGQVFYDREAGVKPPAAE